MEPLELMSYSVYRNQRFWYMKTVTRFVNWLLEIIHEYNGLAQVNGNEALFICSSFSIGERLLSVNLYINLSDQWVRIWNNNKPNGIQMSRLVSAVLLNLSVQVLSDIRLLL